MDNFFEEKTKNQGTSHSEASQEVNGDIGFVASEWEEMVELDDVQLATVVGGLGGGLKGYNGTVGLVPSGDAR